MKNILYKLKYMAAIVACLAACMTSACDSNENKENVSSEPIVGRWHCDYGLSLRAVFFFNKDGTFIFVSLYNFYNAFNNTWSLMPMHYRGKYQVKGGKIEATELWRYQNDLNTSGPDNGAAAAAEIVRIIEKGSRNEVMALLNPRHAYYKANDKDWIDVDDRSGDLEFSDANKKMTTDLLVANNTYVRK